VGIARSASFEVTAEELGAEIALLAQAYDREPKALAKELQRTGQVVTLAGDIIRGKALDLLVERADIKSEEPGVDPSSEPPSGAETLPAVPSPEVAPEEGEPT
jgi:FKBP-type peptidyl-prolyl cis-trans isomerase (trigger factor)